MKPLVFDLGMHDGRDTRAYLDQGYRVVAVEANPTLVKQARKTFARDLSDGTLVIEWYGIGISAEPQPFYINPRNTEWSSFDAGAAGRDGKPCDVVDVPCVWPGYIFETYGTPFYCKVDLEGCDPLVLAAIGALAERPRYLSIEMNDSPDAFAMAALGYELRLVDQRDNYKAPNPSGPFGEQLGGPWVGADEVVEAYLAARVSHPLAWFDLHGRLA